MATAEKKTKKSAKKASSAAAPAAAPKKTKKSTEAPVEGATPASETKTVKKTKTAKTEKAPKAATVGLPKGQFEQMYVALENLAVNKKIQPRTDLGETTSLRKSIKVHGIQQPLAVRPASKDGKFEIVAGGRRYACAVELKLKEVPVIVRTDLADDGEALAFAAAENSGDSRHALSPLDQAAVYKKLSDTGLTPSQVASKCGCTDQHVRSFLRFVDAPKFIQDRLRNGELSSVAATAVLTVNPDLQKQVVEDIAQKVDEGSLRKITEKQVRERANILATEGGVEAKKNPTRGKGSSSTGHIALTRTKKEVQDRCDELVLAILDAKDDKDEETVAAKSNALSALFWYLGTVDAIDIDNKDFKKAYKEIADRAEETDEG